MNKIYILILIAILGSSCEDFLDENPSKTSSLVPTEVEHLDNLLNNYSSFYSESNKDIIFSTDDFGLIKDLYDARSSIYSLDKVHFATWSEDYLADDDRPYWPSEFKKIFTANMVLAYADEVSGTKARKELVKSEAHFLRVYSYFQLANTYCLPYSEANKNELGLPLKKTTSFEESAKRATLEETWEFMKADLEKALALDVKLVKVGDKKYKTWRASRASVYAFASRFYLALNDYKKSKTYAEKALQEHSEIIDYNTEMRYSSISSTEDVEGEVVELKYPYTHDNQSNPTDMMEWKELYYYRFLSNGSWWFIPSESLLNTYNQEYDLRYKYHMVEHYSYDRGCISPKYDYPGYIFFFKDKLPNGPTVAEMILNRAECEIRLGNWENGLSIVNELRINRMDKNAPDNIIKLSAENASEALTKVLEERRREMPFTSRWYDLRRYNNNDTDEDDVVLTREFYQYNGTVVFDKKATKTYTLEKKSRRYANPIPNVDIDATLGVLEQNVY